MMGLWFEFLEIVRKHDSILIYEEKYKKEENIKEMLKNIKNMKKELRELEKELKGKMK